MSDTPGGMPAEFVDEPENEPGDQSLPDDDVIEPPASPSR
jgi:hypothetical protein